MNSNATTGRAVRLQKADGCDSDVDRILALARSGVMLLADTAGDWIVDGRMLAAKSGVVAELDPDMVGRPGRTDVSFTDRSVDRNMVARYWHVRLDIERDLDLLPIGLVIPVNTVPFCGRIAWSAAVHLVLACKWRS
jgi:hypothetical protein